PISASGAWSSRTTRPGRWTFRAPRAARHWPPSCAGRWTMWFQPPRLLTLGEEGERHASWLELFFDLVFVVAITELSQYLVSEHSAGGFVRFTALFVPVWVAWQ